MMQDQKDEFKKLVNEIAYIAVQVGEMYELKEDNNKYQKDSHTVHKVLKEAYHSKVNELTLAKENFIEKYCAS